MCFYNYVYSLTNLAKTCNIVYILIKEVFFMNDASQGYQTSAAPVGQLKTNRELLKYILLSLITFGIYGLVLMSSISTDMNVVASRYDGKKTMHFCLLAFVVAPLTLGIGGFVWYHKISNRMSSELVRRNIAYDFNASTFWLWSVLGSFIIVGPYIYYYKMFKAMNLICEHYNING